MTTNTPQVGTPVKHGAGWYVPSGRVGYFVEWLHESARWRCTCPSFRYRGHIACKHIMRVRKGVSMG
jgi:SWIM zinc finger